MRLDLGSRDQWTTRGNAVPTPPITDLADGVLVNPGDHCQRVRWNTLSEQASDVNDLFARELGHWRLFAAQVDQPDFPLVLRVAGQAYPLQVLGRVVQSVSVDVVDGQAVNVAWAERQCNEPMQTLTDALSVLQNGNLEVAVACRKGADLSLRKSAAESRRLSEPCARVRCRVRRRLHSGLRRDQPSQPLGFDSSPLFNICHTGVISAWQT